MLPLLLALGVKNPAWPRYASVINFEAYASGGATVPDFVRIIYNGNELALPACGHDAVCSWKEWLAIVAAVVPSNLKAVCAPSSAYALEARNAAMPQKEVSWSKYSH